MDAVDSAVGTAFAFASGAGTGIADVSLFGVSLSDPLVTMGATEVSFAFVTALAALLFAWVTNDHDLGQMDQRQVVLVFGTAFVLVITTFVPGAREAVIGSAVLGTLVVVVEAVGYGVRDPDTGVHSSILRFYREQRCYRMDGIVSESGGEGMGAAGAWYWA